MIRKLLATMVGAAAFGGAVLYGPQARATDTPPPSYYIAFNSFYNGDYQDALRAFQSELRSAIKTSQSRWIDSICYETMCGECYYQMGVLDQALLHYTNALQLYKQFPDWMVKVQFEPAIQPAGPGARKAVPWGASTRQSKLGHYRSTESIVQSHLTINSNAQGGGIGQQSLLYPITPQEIIRCTVLALRRRAAILGPVSKYDPLSNDVLSALSGAVGLPNHWSGSWIDLEHAMALIADGREGQAVGYLNRAVVAGGEFDHPMTCVALLELGRLRARPRRISGGLEVFQRSHLRSRELWRFRRSGRGVSLWRDDASDR